jgi:uncharacterized membrane protein
MKNPAMNDSRLPTILYFVLLLLGIMQWAHVYPQLPNVMASHFTARGIPNGWQSKPVFFLLMAIVIVVTAVPAFLVPRRLPSMPPDKINLPNKSYWLAPEHREATWSFFRAQMAWFGCAVLFVLLYAASQAINANLPNIGQFDWQGMWYVLGGFLLFCTGWLIHLLHHFYHPPESGIS